MENLELRIKIKNNRLKNYEIANELGVSEFTFSRWLREELSAEKRSLVTAAIEKLVQEVKEIE